jgi:hypothetical protein
MNRNYSKEHVTELETLPETYTVDMAVKNKDVVLSAVRPHNTERFYGFLSNIDKGIPDKIRITAFESDNADISTKSILQYDGSSIIYTVFRKDSTTYYGDKIIASCRNNNDIFDYYLTTADSQMVPVYWLSI